MSQFDRSGRYLSTYLGFQKRYMNATELTESNELGYCVIFVVLQNSIEASVTDSG
jgi:hypothetical protein